MAAENRIPNRPVSGGETNQGPSISNPLENRRLESGWEAAAC